MSNSPGKGSRMGSIESAKRIIATCFHAGHTRHSCDECAMKAIKAAYAEGLPSVDALRRIGSLEDQLGAAEKSEEKATEEFNAGFDAYRAGVRCEDEPSGMTEDQWGVGWAWAAFDDLRSIVEAARDLNGWWKSTHLGMGGDHKSTYTLHRMLAGRLNGVVVGRLRAALRKYNESQE